MNVLIRDINPSVVQKIDELAQKKNLSRNEFLKKHLSNLSMVEQIEDVESRYIEMQKKMLWVIEQNTEALHQFVEEFHEFNEEDES
ncbi:hypothetical protein [Paenibacillus larvae]|uniref:Ribbon-helix-helix protein CopG domain-containing protein n=1 Tax=Paenibacillus larvae subsp. larvae TaxID=147375 RepID=A0A2L1U7C3_9BACL|nr:hypothetical protein [Paenibacillus larvae]AVF28839.1 hypothetical protein ERICIII_04835 [Paenibacillus larvae subsp. larvae]MCY9500301.1 hypothetical protein [Paenibacillus larvae]MCY9746951.1 hypothetical protein [Paenibacillus larvae]MCY9752445.1 hypothetical protein [Paenibacillus larvae]MDR5608737.1 hypothetical protein [Paenibacillus larvae]